MKKGYWVVAYRSISDEAAAREYSKVAGPYIESRGGKILTRSLAIETFEAGLKQRTVVVEFESVQDAIDTYKSDRYKEALALLGSAAERDFRILEGA